MSAVPEEVAAADDEMVAAGAGPGVERTPRAREELAGAAAEQTKSRPWQGGSHAPRRSQQQPQQTQRPSPRRRPQTRDEHPPDHHRKRRLQRPRPGGTSTRSRGQSPPTRSRSIGRPSRPGGARRTRHAAPCPWCCRWRGRTWRKGRNRR